MSSPARATQASAIDLIRLSSSAARGARERAQGSLEGGPLHRPSLRRELEGDGGRGVVHRRNRRHGPLGPRHQLRISRRRSLRQLSGLRGQVVGSHAPPHEPATLRFLAVEHLSEECERRRALPSHHPLEPPERTAARVDPDVEEAEVETRGRRADGDVAAEEQRDAGADGRAVDRRHGGHGCLVQSVEGPVDLLEADLGLEELVHRPAGAEHGWGVAQDERTRAVGRRAVDGLAERSHQLPRKGVARTGVVQHDGRNPGGFLDADGSARHAHQLLRPSLNGCADRGRTAGGPSGRAP